MAQRKRTAIEEAAFEVASGSIEDTRAFGEQVGRLLKAGDVIALFGELGSGKTTFIQGLARGLGRDPETIKSPTFVLMRAYSGEPALIHIDGYRIEGPPSVTWLDLDLVFSPGAITVIEWAERFSGLLPDSSIEIRLSHVSANRRKLLMIPSSERAKAVIVTLQELATHHPPLATPKEPHAAPRD